MPRAATTTDVFNAIAEPRRRDIIEALAGNGALPVGELVEALKLPQPTVSKHLGVLREVGIVSVNRRGRQRLYQLNARQLKPVHDWTSRFQRYWTQQLDRIRSRAERNARDQARARDARAEPSP
jgi:DNA-binding transcriptional ArsR family regulator